MRPGRPGRGAPGAPPKLERHQRGVGRQRPVCVSSAALDRHPLQEPAGLDVKESAELVEGLGMEAAETASGAGEPIRAGISQVRALTQFIGCDATRRHEFVYSESHHNTFRVEPHTPYATALRYTALQYTVYVVQ